MRVELLPYTEHEAFLKNSNADDWSHRLYDVRKLHRLGHRGKGIKIGVIDSGVDASHSCFKKAVAEGRLTVENPIGGRPDGNGHGTWVCSRIIGEGSVIGYAPDAELISIKGLRSDGTGDVGQLLASVEDLILRHKVHIISTSIGWDQTKANRYLNSIAKLAKEKNVIWVSAAGNDGRLNGINNPAANNKIISVGSINKYLTKSDFSNWGCGLDLYDAGERVYGAWLNGQCKYLSGTSMATPTVAAKLAVLYPYIQTKNFEGIKSITKCLG